MWRFFSRVILWHRALLSYIKWKINVFLVSLKDKNFVYFRFCFSAHPSSCSRWKRLTNITSSSQILKKYKEIHSRRSMKFYKSGRAVRKCDNFILSPNRYVFSTCEIIFRNWSSMRMIIYCLFSVSKFRENRKKPTCDTLRFFYIFEFNRVNESDQCFCKGQGHIEYTQVNKYRQ